MNDLIDALERTHNPIEIVELLNNFIFNQEDLNSYAIKNNICPKCYSDLRIHSWREPRGECFGFSSKETLSELRCEGCNWVDW